MHLKKGGLIFVLFLLFSSLHAQDTANYLYLKMDTSKPLDQYGYANSDGKMVIPFGKYPYAYTDTIKTIGFVLIKHRGLWAINTKGKELFKGYTFDNGPDYVREGLFRMKDNRDKIGFANMLGEIVIKPQYEGAFPFDGGIAPICKGCITQKIANGEYHEWVKGKWGYIDKAGKIVIPIDYDKLDHRGKAVSGKIILKKDNIIYRFDKDSLLRINNIKPEN